MLAHLPPQVSTKSLLATGFFHFYWCNASAFMFGNVPALLSTIMANIVVVGVTSTMLVLMGSTLYMLVDAGKAKNYVIGGVILALAVSLISTITIGTVPLSFDQVREMGLATIPDNPVSLVIGTLMELMMGLAEYASSMLLVAGVLLTIARVNWGPKMVLVGIIMTFMVYLVSSGGLIGMLVNVFSNQGSIISPP